MNQDVDLAKLLRLRKATRAVADYFRGALNDHLRALQPLFSPTLVLGEYIRNTPKQRVRTADAALKELKALYARVGHAKPFRFDDDLRPPLDLFGASAEIAQVTYAYRPAGDAGSIQVTRPLRWVLTYKGQGPARLVELLTSTSGTARMELQNCLLHCLLMSIIAGQAPGPASILRALRYAVTIEPVERLGGLPVVYITAPVATGLPSDETIMQSTELTGSTVFEEIIDVESILHIEDPIRDAALRLVRECGDELVP